MRCARVSSFGRICDQATRSYPAGRRHHHAIADSGSRAADWSAPKIGFLGPSSAATAKERVAAFERRLGELGWVPDRTVTIRYQWADGRAEKFKEIAADFVRRRVDVIATWGTATALAAKEAT